jgi:charged multivesicular body protein 1
MAGIVKSLDSAMKANNLEKVASTMDLFERQLEDLDVQTDFVESAMQNQTVLSTPEDDVNMLVQQVADEHGLETGLSLPQAAAAKVPAQKVAAPEPDLAQRLAELKNSK